MPQVTVTVDKDGKIECAPDPVPVVGKDTTIDFLLATEGYAFPDSDAVVMKMPAPDFPHPSTTLGPGRVSLVDLNKIKGLYHYSVTVVDTRTRRPIELDPGINNDGGG